MKISRRSILACVLVLAAVASFAPAALAQGVTLFQNHYLSGPHQTFYDDVPDLKYTQFGSRRASSIAVPPGCTAVLYQYPHYKGRSTVFRDDDNNLGNTAVGEYAASSLRVNCRGHYPGWQPEPEPERRHGGWEGGWGHWESGQRGAILYRDREGKGPRAFFDRDVPDLDRTRFGSRMASSIDVTPGCIVTLYELPGYRGRHTDFRERDNNLKNTAVGEDTVSSLRVRCR
ncbi:MAG TPA: beta/gamma crystallin-related protein [Thermoanaerobaculia bacterium]|nr:beta/gamma crystallin-related protein [Thermoanaerobaculia bacterium]